MDTVQQAREAFNFARDPNNHDYAERAIKFGQVMIALCLDQITYADIGSTPEDFDALQEGFSGVVDKVMTPC